MSIRVHSITWGRSFFEVRYTASMAQERLALCRIKTDSWLYPEVIAEGDACVARFNVVNASNREPLDAGEWIICEKIDASLAADRSALLAEKPYLKAVMERDFRNTLPKNKRKTPEAYERAAKEGYAFFARHPYDVQGISYDEDVMLGADSLQRVFAYAGGKYAYTALLRPRMNANDYPFMVLVMSFYVQNDNPHVRKGSLRFYEKRILSAVFRAFSSLTSKRGNRILFLKENGNGPTENMAALQTRIRERGLDQTYVIQERYHNIFEGRQKPLEWIKDLICIARADYIFIDDYCPVFNFLNLDKRTVLTQIWHAGVGFKSVGYARFGLAGSPDPYASSHRAYTYAIVGNAGLRNIYAEVFGIEKEALLATGMPRLDHFLDEDVAAAAKNDMLSRYPWMDQGRVIVFAPTFRGTGQEDAYYPYDAFFNMSQLYEMCVRTESYFVFEMHHFVKDAPAIPDGYRDRVFDLSSESLNSLFYVADLLITDYSSCFYDYQLLKKPVVFYTPDRVEYSATRGVQRPVKEMAPGVVCDSFDELMETLEGGSYHAVAPPEDTLDRCIEKNGLASDRVIDAVLLSRKEVMEDVG